MASPLDRYMRNMRRAMPLTKPAASVDPEPSQDLSHKLDALNLPYLRYGDEEVRARIVHAPPVHDCPRLRVLFCGNSLTVGGAETLGVNLAKALQQRGHSVTYWCRQAVETAALDTGALNVVSGDVVAAHAAGDWDVVLHVNGDSVSDLAGRYGNEVVIIQPFGVVPYNYASLKGLEKRDRTVLWCYSSIGAVMRKRLPIERVYALRGGIDLAKWKRKTRRRGKRLQLGYVGRVGSEKALDKMCSVALWLHNNGVPCDFWRVGGPDPQHPDFFKYQQQMLDSLRATKPYRDAIAAGILQEPGLVPDVLPYYQAIDCLLITSKFEAEPVMFLEGMATGCVCASRNIGEIDRLLGDGRGILVPAQRHEMDETEIAQMGAAIKAAWETPADWRKMAAKGRDWVLGNHSVVKMAEDFEAVVSDANKAP